MTLRILDQVRNLRAGINPGDLQKDAVPLPSLQTHLYSDGGIWSMCTDEVISDVVAGGSVLMNWIPSRGVNTVESRVAHLSWIGPAGFDGAESYMDYLAELAPAEDCGYGPTDDWYGFEYSHVGHCFSRTSPTLKPEDFGLMWCDRQPIMRVRGAQTGENLTNDAEWALAKAAIGLENHLNWNLIWGNPSIAPYTYDGIDQIIRPGWVAAHIVGSNPAVFSDPLYVNGATLTTPTDIMQTLKGMVRKIRTRAIQRGYSLTPNDYAIVMTSAHWTYLADAIALGLLMAVAPTTLDVSITPEGFFRERDRITSGYYGYGFIPIDGQPVPIIIEDQLGANSTTGGEATVTGDIYILTRYFRGMTVLEHQYRNWNAIQGYPTSPTEVILQNGMLRAGWVIEANKCFYYYVEGCARLLSMMQPLQGRITDVTVETLLDNELESGSPTHQDWYAYDGARGGQGVALVQGFDA